MTEPKMTKSRLLPMIALMLGCIAVVVCYYFIDRPVAWFCYQHRFYSDEFLLWPTLISDWLTDIVILGMAVVVAWRFWRPGGPLQTLLFSIAVNLAATAGIKTVLKGAFGRTWPRDWLRSQVGQLAHEVYGFHPFRFDQGYHSFPSGHAASTFAVISMLWIARPKWRWLYAAVGGLMCVALVGMNYHFVGDVIGGGVLGSVTGICATRIFHLRPER